jgi:opacity protein-like surface antigen
VNTAAIRSSSAPTASPIRAASASILITPPRTSGSFSQTLTSISAPGGASPRSSAPCVGGARVAINGFTDQGIANNGAGALPGLAFGDNVSKWNMAWAVHAGLAYKVTPNFTVELAYRYLDMGDGLTGDLRTFDGTNNVNNPMTFKNLTSHDLKLGVRWNLESPQVYAPPPLMRKG